MTKILTMRYKEIEDDEYEEDKILPKNMHKMVFGAEINIFNPTYKKVIHSLRELKQEIKRMKTGER